MFRLQDESDDAADDEQDHLYEQHLPGEAARAHAGRGLPWDTREWGK
ncbi:hypothetical protein [Streptomyces griseoluteus]